MQSNQNLPTVKEYSAGVVLFKETDSQRKYLILHYPSGHFDFPKGHLEKNENEEQAARRELTEETGIAIADFYPGFQTEMTYDFRRHNHKVHKKVTFFLAETGVSQVIISHEHQGYLWLGFEDALVKITFENARQILRQAEEILNNKHKNNENHL